MIRARQDLSFIGRGLFVSYLNSMTTLPPRYEPPYVDDKTDSLEMTSMRIHELCILRWLNKAFIFKEGYPIPVIFATPRDAHAEFLKLWKLENNPFRYLTEMKDANGKQVFPPYPPTVVYPLISVARLNWNLRLSQSYGHFTDRTAYYPTINGNGTVGSDGIAIGNGTVTQDDMAWAASVNRPTAWDFRFQIDHYCNQPQTQSIFVNRVMKEFRNNGYTFLMARYPFPHTRQFVRCYLESGIENVNNDALPDQNQEIRTSFTIVVEGYHMDYETNFSPVMWSVGLGQEKTTVDPSTLSQWFDFNDIYGGLEDVRVGQANPAIQSRANLPPPSTRS
jgi:hypothetical protein